MMSKSKKKFSIFSAFVFFPKTKRGQFFIIAAVLVGLLLVAFVLNQLAFKASQPVREESAISLFNNIKEKSKRTVILSSGKEEINYTKIESNLETFKQFAAKQCDKSYLNCELEFKLEGDIVLFDLTVKADDLYLHDEFKQKVEKKKLKIVADAGPDKFVNVGEITLFDASGSFSSSKIVSYYWDFGDGTTAEGKIVEHSYKEKGTYTVTLTTTDEKNQTDSDELVVQTTELDIFAEADPDRRELIQTLIAFSGSNSYSTKGGIISYTWDFGDGNSAEGIQVSHIYGKEGTYVITLIIIDDKGNTAIDTATIEITKELLQAPVAEAGEEKQSTLQQSISFDGSNSYDPDGEIVSYHWEFGDGATAEGKIVEHQYSQPGEYIAKLIVTDNNGLTGIDTTLAAITGEFELIADAGPDQESIIDKEICFDASGSKSNNPIVQYYWEFGGGEEQDSDEDDDEDEKNEFGEKATGEKICHIYNNEGTYVITLTIIDSLGNSAKDTATVIISKELLSPPIADAGEDKITVQGTTVVLDGSKSSDKDGYIVSYKWKLPDGSTTGKMVDYTFANVGTYTITLTVTDNSGLIDTDTITIIVREKKEEFCSFIDTNGFRTTLNSVTDKGETLLLSFSTTGFGARYSLSHIVFGLQDCGYEAAKKTAGSNPSWPVSIVTPDPSTKINGLKYDETSLTDGQTASFTFEIPKTCIGDMAIATKAGTQNGYIKMGGSCFTLS